MIWPKSQIFSLQAEAKKRKILSVKNVDELTDEKIELYTNRMKETILKERTKATRQAAGNNKIDVKTTLTCLNESNPLQPIKGQKPDEKWNGDKLKD